MLYEVITLFNQGDHFTVLYRGKGISLTRLIRSTGLGQAENILALKNGGDRLFLDGGRIGVT